jgi:hypothetical protein
MNEALQSARGSSRPGCYPLPVARYLWLAFTWSAMSETYDTAFRIDYRHLFFFLGAVCVRVFFALICRWPRSAFRDGLKDQEEVKNGTKRYQYSFGVNALAVVKRGSAAQPSRGSSGSQATRPRADYRKVWIFGVKESKGRPELSSGIQNRTRPGKKGVERSQRVVTHLLARKGAAGGGGGASSGGLEEFGRGRSDGQGSAQRLSCLSSNPPKKMQAS